LGSDAMIGSASSLSSFESANAMNTGTVTLAAARRIICLSLSKYSPGEKDSKATIPCG